MLCMISTHAPADIVMLGTFAAWRAGTIQSRALPFARILQDYGFRVVIVTTPWDEPGSAGQIDIVAGIPIINTQAISPLRTPLAVGEQLRMLSQLQPQAVHVIKPRGFGGLAAERLLHARQRPRLVVDADDWEGDGGWNDVGAYPVPMQRLFNWQESRLLRRADHVVAASALVAARASRLRADDSTVSLIPNGIDASWRQQLDRASRETRCPAVHRVLIYSRFQEFEPGWIDGFAKSLGSNVTSPLEIVLIGSTDRPRGAQQFSPNVTVTNLGWVDRRQLPATLATGNLAVFPLDDSLISRSKQSAKLIELMAAGIPVIASDVGEVRATLGEAGLTIRNGSPAQFASQTAKLLGDPERRAAMSELARSQAKRLDIATVAHDLPGIYLDLGVEPS